MGLGNMLYNIFGGSEYFREQVSKILNKTIRSLLIENNILKIEFDDNTKIEIYDYPDCYERRWMHTDDDLSYFQGSKLLGIEIKQGNNEIPKTDPNNPDKYYDVLENQFLVITTSLGVFTIVNYNDHNGYYSGFNLSATVQ